jgi:hypothetical protein
LATDAVNGSIEPLQTLTMLQFPFSYLTMSIEMVCVVVGKRMGKAA